MCRGVHLPQILSEMDILTVLEDKLLGRIVKVRISAREKNFNTAVVTIICLVFSVIPLFGSNIEEDIESTVSFRSKGTLMQLGTQPFVFASFLLGFVKDSSPSGQRQQYVAGFVLSIIQSVQWCYQNSILGGLQLLCMSYLLLQVLVWLETFGSISLSSVLIFASASQKIVTSVLTPLTLVWTLALILLVTWLEKLCVTIPLTHKSARHVQSMPIPLLYNNTTALVIYFTVIETISSVFPPFALLFLGQHPIVTLVTLTVMFVSIVYINKELPRMQKTTGRDTVSNWRKQSYTVKGWRHKSAVKYVQRVIDKNLVWNSVIVYVLWILGTIFPPSCGITTLFIVVSVPKSLGESLWSQW